MAAEQSGERQILDRINDLIESEHRLRAGDHDPARLRELEEALDQCWDLLRRRRARQEFGQDPDGVTARPASEVEHYQQ